MKKLSLLCVIFFVLITTCLPVTANGAIINHTISDSECLDFLERNGIAVPSAYDNEEDCIPFIRYVLEKLYANPETLFIFNAKELVEFSHQIQQAFWAENNYTPLMACEAAQEQNNILQDNEVVGEWTDDYYYYNCYAYAIGYERDIQPGQLVWEEEIPNAMRPQPNVPWCHRKNCGATCRIGLS